jgi:hypothetical protein
MRSGYLFGILAVLAGATLGWLVLGSTLVVRTSEANQTQRQALSRLYGGAQTQTPMSFAFWTSSRDAKGKVSWEQTASVPRATEVHVDLGLEQRQKGLLWYNTYAVAYRAAYRIEDAAHTHQLHVHFAFPADNATYDDFAVSVDGRPVSMLPDGVGSGANVAITRDIATVSVSYRSRGLDDWSYRLGNGTGVTDVRNFTLAMNTNFAAIDFPPQSLAPTTEVRTPEGWALTWHYNNLVAGNGIGISFPERLQPGLVAQRVTFWAPLSLLFYVFVMLIVTTLRRIELHPINYFFLACAFFAFHLLLAYTVDRLPLAVAFVLCAVVSMFLTISYLRLVVGLRFAAVEAALAQFFYLILFSYALFDEGFSGLTITIGAIVTLFVTMQLTGRIRWAERVVTKVGA